MIQGDISLRLHCSKNFYPFESSQMSDAPSFQSHDVIIRFVTENLPNHIGKRRELLDALSQILPEEHGRRSDVQEMLLHLDLHIIATRELPLKFDPTTTGEPQP